MEYRFDLGENQLYLCGTKYDLYIEIYEYKTGNDLNVTLSHDDLNDLIVFLQQIQKAKDSENVK